MWIPLLAMALAVSLEPFRVGMTVLMLNRPRPTLQLLVVLVGGFAMGTAVGLVVLFLLRPALGSGQFTLPRVQLAVGALLLLNAALVALGVFGGRRSEPSTLRQRCEPALARMRSVATGGSLWTAGVVGLGIALPSVDYLAALALIVASGAAAATQVGAAGVPSDGTGAHARRAVGPQRLAAGPGPPRRGDAAGRGGRRPRGRGPGRDVTRAM
jgi:hypothetical protein